MATVSAEAVAPRGIPARAIVANSALKNQGFRDEKFHANAFGGCLPGRLRRFFGSAFSRIHPQFPHHDLRSSPGSYQETWPDSAGHRKGIWQLQLRLRRLRRYRSRVRVHQGRGLLLCRMVVRL